MATIKQLCNFLVLCRELHFARAAEKLGISQATLSNEIKKMEQDLGFQLFDRSNRWGITLTDAGKSYWFGVKEIPEMLEGARQNAAEIARGHAGILTIGISNFSYDYFDMGELCRKMRERYPDIQLKIYDMQRSPHVVESLRRGQIDVGFFMISSENTRRAEGFNYKKLLSIELNLALPSTHILASKAKIEPEDLKNCHFILPPREELPTLRKKLDDYFMEKFNKSPIIQLEVLGFAGIRQLIGSGLGVGFLPNRLKVASNVILKKSPFSLSSTLIAARNEDNNSQVVKNFMNLLPSQMKDN